MRKALLSYFSLSAIAFLVFAFTVLSAGKDKEPWTKKQLVAPSALAKTIRGGKAAPYIFSVGPSGLIKNAIQIGPCSDKANLQKLREALNPIPKDANIIIYCGCCPYEHCPNIRPAFSLLNEMHFTNQKLLNLPHNLKADWIDKGYPMEE